jgi:hypothetical protein
MSNSNENNWAKGSGLVNEMRLNAAPEIRTYEERGLSYDETEQARSVLFLVMGSYLLFIRSSMSVSTVPGSVQIPSILRIQLPDAAQSMQSFSLFSWTLALIYVFMGMNSLLQFLSIRKNYAVEKGSYSVATICVVLHMAVIFTFFDWTTDNSSTPIRFVLVAYVALAAGYGSIRSYTYRLATDNILDRMMILKHTIDVLACSSVLFFFEWLPVSSRSSIGDSGHTAEGACFNAGASSDLVSNDLLDFSIVKDHYGVESMHTPGMYFATIIFSLFGVSTAISCGRWWRALVYKKTPSGLTGRSTQIYAVLRGVIIPTVSMILIIMELVRHVDRMTHDSAITTGRECAPFMQRSIRYFASVGLDLQSDCRIPQHPYASHCGACQRGGFGVSTFGEDIVSSQFVTTVLAVWIVADSSVSLIFSRIMSVNTKKIGSDEFQDISLTRTTQRQSNI